MAGILAQFAAPPYGITRTSQGKMHNFRRTKQVPQMMCNMQSHSLRIRSYVGLSHATDRGKMASSTKNFYAAGAVFTMARQARKAQKRVVTCLFEMFTERAINVMGLSQDEARRLGQGYVGTEQILLGLIGEGTGIPAKVLKSMGVNLQEARIEVERIVGRGSMVLVEVPFNPKAKRVMQLALEEAQQLGHNYIGAEHLLLGLLCDVEGATALVLEKFGVEPENIQTQVMRMVGERSNALGAGVGSGTSSNEMPTLEEYGTNLTKLAEEGEPDPVVGRRLQIERVIQILRNIGMSQQLEIERVIQLLRNIGISHEE